MRSPAKTNRPAAGGNGHANQQRIFRGANTQTTGEEAMTGRAFCELLEINYNEINRLREQDQMPTVRFLSELVKIDGIKSTLLKLLKTGDG